MFSSTAKCLVGIGLALIVLTLAAPAGATAFNGYTLYDPTGDLGTYPRASSSYPSGVRLDHPIYSGDLHKVLVVHDWGNNLTSPGSGQRTMGLPVYTVSPNGSATFVSYIDDSGHHPTWQKYFPTIYEFPQQLGSYPAGTLVVGLNSMSPDGVSPAVNDLDVYRSDDDGQTWHYMSSCATQPSYSAAHGIWEATFGVDSAGRLVCYFSDERYSGSAGSQQIGHVTSTDGGVTWSNASSNNGTSAGSSDPGETIDVAPVGSDRPGMPTVVKLPTGGYLMAYEACGTYQCAAFYKSSTDGDSWGTGYGTKITTSDGRWVEGNPYLLWVPAGSNSNGTLIIRGRTIRDSAYNTTPESRHTFLVNTSLGSGSWSEMPAPVEHGDVSYAYCQGYRGSMVASADGESILYFDPIDLGSTSDDYQHCKINFASTTTAELPFYAPLPKGTDEGWTDYGGTWTAQSGSGIYSDSAVGYGDKAVAGSTGWTDYTLQGDVRFDGSQSGASVGLLFRVTRPSAGVDTLNGYFVGIDTTGTLFVGKENGSWSGLSGSAAVSGGYHVGTWYHIVVQAVGCSFRVSAAPVGTSTPASFTATDSSCFTSGQVGIREFATNASWRNISVTPGGTSLYDPVSDPWASGSSSWPTYGGTWSISALDESVTDTAGGLGDKALFPGSSGWGYSTVTSDVSLGSTSGDAGLLARVTSPGVGANAYQGYYAGVSGPTGGVVLGRANSGTYTPLGGATMADGVTAGSWYHLTFQHTGCSFVVTAQLVTSQDKTTYSTTDAGCFGTGSVGIRTYNTTASWRFFSMLPR